MIPGDGTITVDFGAMAGQHAALQANMKSLESKLTTLETSLQPLILSWSGEAQAAYLVQNAAWDKAATDLGEMLQAIINALSQTHQDYTQTEKNVTAAFL